MSGRISEISRLKNLGGKTEEWLNDIGIYTREALESIGSVEIYRILKQRGYNVTLNLIYGIEGALADIDWRDLSQEQKAELRAAIRNL